MKLSKNMRILMRVSTLILFFILGINVGCSVFKQDRDNALVSYKKGFAKVIGINDEELDYIGLTFNTLQTDESSAVGRCNMLTDDIQIDPKYFFRENINEKSRMALVYHEYVHCYCRYIHDTKQLKDGCSASIMDESLPSLSCLNKHWDHYMEDVKLKCKETLEEFDIFKLIREKEFEK